MINRDSEVSQVENTENLLGNDPVSEKQEQKKQRLNSLDVHRGLTMIGMIIVDYGRDAYWVVTHEPWNGVSPADLVFPSFLFIMGVAVPLAVTEKNPIKIKTIFRTFVLILIGLFVQLYGCHFDFSTLRYLGILQRLGLCYGAILFIHWVTKYGRKDYRIIGVVISILLGAIYIAFMLPFQDIPDGCTHQNNLTKYCNFDSYVNRLIFHSQHMYRKQYDPQGLFTTLNAIISAYMGYYFCLIMKDYKKDHGKLLTRWIVLSFFFAVLTYPLTYLMPINKSLWSTSFTFLSGSVAGYTLAVLLVLVDYTGKNCPNYQKILDILTRPFIWLGRNPLAIFFLLQIFSELVDGYIMVNDDQSLSDWFFNNALYTWISSKAAASAVYSMIWVVIYAIIAGILHYYKIFIRV